MAVPVVQGLVAVVPVVVKVALAEKVLQSAQSRNSNSKTRKGGG